MEIGIGTLIVVAVVLGAVGFVPGADGRTVQRPGRGAA